MRPYLLRIATVQWQTATGRSSINLQDRRQVTKLQQLYNFGHGEPLLFACLYRLAVRPLDRPISEHRSHLTSTLPRTRLLCHSSNSGPLSVHIQMLFANVVLYGKDSITHRERAPKARMESYTRISRGKLRVLT